MSVSSQASSGLKSFLSKARSSYAKVLSSGTSGGAPLQQQQHVHLFIGNEAADPDSIISSLCSAFLFHSQQQTEAVAAVGTGAVTGTGDGAATCMTCVAVPMCCIPRADLVLRRDTQLLFRMAGLDINDLVCLDDTTDSDSSTGTNTATGLSSLPALQEKGLLSITLTDHNALAHKWGEGGAAAALDQAVVAIVDHHEDKGEHAHVRGSARNVAFDASTGREEAGSCCTLVAENFLLARHSNSSSSSSMGIADGEGDGELTSSLPEDIALLLSGVILLDTCNMDAAVGKGRPRDAAALDALFAAMPPEKRGMRDSIFRELNGAKTDPTFWAALSARDALRLDYKHFRVGRGRALGMSSVLLSLSHLKNKDDLESALAAHFTPSVARKGVDLLVCMCMVVPEEGIAGERRRELMVVGSRIQLDALREFLDKDEAGKAMGAAIVGHRMILAPAPGAATESSVDAADAADEVLMADCYAQANVRMSRKQAAPLLERFLAGL